MKKQLTLLCISVLLVVMCANAQSNPPGLDEQVTALLKKFPAYDSAQFENNMQTIASLGEKGLEKMASMLSAHGKGDNTALEYAISGFSYYTTQKQHASLKVQVSAVYIRALQNLQDKENKAFIIRQLQLTGDDATIPALKPFLADEQLADPAARALVKINTGLAKKTLADALKTATGNTRNTLIESLGELRYSGAVAGISSYAHGSDARQVKLSLYALGRIGDPLSASLLAAAAEKSAYTYEPTDATGAYLAYIQQVGIKNPALADKMASLLLQKTVSDKQVHTHTAALKILVDIRKEKSVPLLVNAMNDKHEAYRAAALKFALAYKSDVAISAWINKLNGSTNTGKAGIITMLGVAENASALPAVLNQLHDGNAAVRAAAIGAAVRIGQQKALSPLLQLLQKGNEIDITPIQQAILMMKGDGVVAQVANALPATQQGNAKAALIQILAARSAVNSINAVLPLVKSTDTAVSHAAFSALKTMAGQDNLPQLFSLLADNINPENIQPVQQAIIAASSKIADTSARIKLVTDQMNQSAAAGKKQLYLGILPGVGGKEALAIVSSAYTTGDPQTKNAVIQALSGWVDAGATNALLQISRENAANEYGSRALDAYIKMAAGSFYPADQRLLILRNAMDLAKKPTQRILILDETGRCNTYLSLLFAGKYLDDPALQHVAAIAVVHIGLSNKTWYGKQITAMLEKAAGLLEGQDASYEKEAVRKHLDGLPQGEAFVPMFNGKDLSGWKGLVEDPIQRAKMNPDTLAKKQQAADERMKKGWFAKDNELVFGGNGDNLCSTRKYGDFEMFVDWKITKDGDAGIYLRGSPQVQIWDTARVKVGAQVGSGGLYNNATYPSKPLKLADNAIGEWNSFHITMIGDRVTVYLNGVLVVNNIILENYWNRNLPIFAEEQLELQAHGTLVAYRDIYIREIPQAKPFVLTTEEKNDSFKVLFDGSNMHEWTGNTTDYVLEDGNMAVYPANGGHGNVYTKKEYGDFVYRFDFQLTPGANNGVGIRAPLEGDAAYVGMEIQVLDNEAPMYANLHVYQYHGSVYGVIPAKRGYLKPVGEWNSEEITARGNRIKVVLNGTTILDGDIEEASRNGTADGRDHPGLKRTKGHIGFLGHGDVVRFRNIRVKEL